MAVYGTESALDRRTWTLGPRSLTATNQATLLALSARFVPAARPCSTSDAVMMMVLTVSQASQNVRPCENVPKGWRN